MNLSNNNYNHYLHSAKMLFKEEQSYPSVYRELIKDIAPDDAISILHELQQSTSHIEEEKVTVN